MDRLLGVTGGRASGNRLVNGYRLKSVESLRGERRRTRTAYAQPHRCCHYALPPPYTCIPACTFHIRGLRLPDACPSTATRIRCRCLPSCTLFPRRALYRVLAALPCRVLLPPAATLYAVYCLLLRLPCCAHCHWLRCALPCGYAHHMHARCSAFLMMLIRDLMMTLMYSMEVMFCYG